MSANDNPHPLIISGFSSQALATDIAKSLGSRVVVVERYQFDDKEINMVIKENVRGRDTVIVASASGDPNKAEKETRLLLKSAKRAGAKSQTLVVPYMWYGRADDDFGERCMPGVVDTIESLRPHCTSVIVADPHNAPVTRETFLAAPNVQTCTIAHFAYPYAVELKNLIEEGYISKDALLLSHADAGSVKRINQNFRACMYSVLGFEDRIPSQDDWAQGLKDRDKTTRKSRFKGFSESAEGRDVVCFEDMVSSGGTLVKLAEGTKKDYGARSVIAFATSGLFTTKKEEAITDAVKRISDSKHLDALFLTDTYVHRLTDPSIQEAIDNSPNIHVLKTGNYLGAMIRALHLEVGEDTDLKRNSILAILKGEHPEQQGANGIAEPVPLKAGSPLLKLKPAGVHA